MLGLRNQVKCSFLFLSCELWPGLIEQATHTTQAKAHLYFVNWNLSPCHPLPDLYTVYNMNLSNSEQDVRKLNNKPLRKERCFFIYIFTYTVSVFLLDPIILQTAAMSTKYSHRDQWRLFGLYQTGWLWGADSLRTARYIATQTVIFVTITGLACGQKAVSLNPQSSWKDPGRETVIKLQFPFFSVCQLAIRQSSGWAI